jgi:dipeptidase E
VLRECWSRGVVLAGLSAGSLCWFSEAITAFHGRPQRIEGLGLGDGE